MCGIAGYIQPKSLTAPDPSIIKRMLKRLSHRGPDDTGNIERFSPQWETHLGHQRLAIIDIQGGRQPFCYNTNSLVFNGEIFNFRELRHELISKGITFQTKSDTEVLLQHVRTKGIEGLVELNGMFAFASYNEEKEELILCRDRAGIKPLYYAPLTGGGIAFASELSALLQHPHVPRKIHHKSLASYFFSDYIPAPETLIKGVYKLSPAHYLRWIKGKLETPTRYWDLSIQNRSLTKERSWHRAGSENWELLSQSVKRQLIADVPVGIFLSGGIDSSVIACLAKHHAKKSIKAFSIGFRNKSFDESPYAKKVATHLGVELVQKILDEKDLLSELPSALDSLDEPIADPSILPTYIVSKVAAQHVKVVLGGDGGDELWAGYPTYKAHKYAKLYYQFPYPLKNLCRKLIGQLKVKKGYQNLEWKLKRFTHRWDNQPIRRHQRWMSNTDIHDLQEVFPFFQEEFAFQQNDFHQRQITNLNQFLAWDFQTYLPGSVLTKVDRASMAHSIEVRPPFLDNEVIQNTFELPFRYKLRKNTSKFLLKKHAESVLPKDIIYRKKRGFAIPLSSWIHGPLREKIESIFSDSPVWNQAYVSRETFERWGSEHFREKKDHSKTLWALVVLDHWMKKEAICEFS